MTGVAQARWSRPVPRSLRVARWSSVVALGLVSAIGVVGLVGVLVGSPSIAAVGPLLVVFGWVEWRRRQGVRCSTARAEALPVALDRVLQQLRSGASLSQACQRSGSGLGGVEIGPGAVPVYPLGSMGSALRHGSTLVDAAERLRHDDDPSVRLVGVTIRVLAVNGGPAVPGLQRLRHTLVGRAHRRRRAEATAAGALASAGLLVLAPGCFALVLAGIEPDLARFYLVEPGGAACLGGAVVLSAAGWWWMQRVVARCGEGHR